MKPKVKSHIEFCKAVSRGTTYKDAYRNYVATKKTISDQTCEVNGSVLAKRYAEYIQELKEKDSRAVDKAHENDASNDALKEILSVAQVDAKLCKLIDKLDPRAMDLYYKRFGHYAPTKTESEIVVSEKTIAKLPDGTELEI